MIRLSYNLSLYFSSFVWLSPGLDCTSQGQELYSALLWVHSIYPVWSLPSASHHCFSVAKLCTILCDPKDCNIPVSPSLTISLSLLRFMSTAEKEMAAHSTILAWRILWTGEPGGLLSMGLQSQTRLKRLGMHACIGEGNGNPLQYSCLENSRDRGAWWAAVRGVTQSQTWLKRLRSSSMSIESVMPSSHLILCHPLLLLPSVFSSMKVFSIESALHIRWPECWSFSFSISPSNEYSGLISFRIDWFGLLAVKGTVRLLSNTTVWKHQFSSAQSSLWSYFFICTWLLEKP